MPKIEIEITEYLLQEMDKAIEKGAFFDYNDYIEYCIRNNIDKLKRRETLKQELEILEDELKP